MTFGRATKFVVLSTQRSGSTWLIDTLNNLENTIAYGELFLRQKRVWDAGSLDYPRFIEANPTSPAIRPLSTFAYLDDLYRQPGAVGFKLMYSQLREYPEILIYLCRHHVHVVHLIRRNHLDVIISLEMVRLRGQAHLLSGQQEPKAIQVHLSPETLIGRIKWLRKKSTMVRKLVHWCRLPHLEVAYEDLLHNPSHFGSILDFLSVDSEGYILRSNLSKIRQAKQVDVISNYDEVKEVLASSAFTELIK